jgi:hypothetical protein
MELVHEFRSYSVTIGFDVARNTIGEVFTHGAKVGSAMDAILDDACVTLSLLLQHGVEPAALAASMGRLGDGKTPASIIGTLADLLAREAQR